MSSELSQSFATKAELADLREQLRRLEERIGTATLVEDNSKAAAVSVPSQSTERAEPAGSGQGWTKALTWEDRKTTVSLTESTWDAAILIGMPAVGAAGSFLLVLGLLINVIIQAVFIMIIWENLAQKVFSEEDLQGLSAFRHKIAHDSRFVSDTSGFSLADRVCGEDLTLEMATTQVTTLTRIRAYLGKEGEITQYLNGPLMCQIALAVWIMCILKEISTACNTFSALRQLPSRRSGSVVGGSHEEGFKLEAFGRRRKIFALVICMLRLTVAVVLLWIGTQYLCYTTDIGDLLLNAIALEVVINVDEMVYSAICPVSATEMIADLAPLSMTSWPRWRGADMGSLAAPVLMAGLLVFCGFTSLASTVDNLNDAEMRLCGNDTNFMYSLDGLAMVRVQHLASFDVDQAYNRDGVTSRAVEEVKDRQPQSLWQYALLASSSASQRFMDQASERAMATAVSDIYRSRQDLGESALSACHDALDRIETLEDTPLLSNQWRAWPGYLGRALGLSEPVMSCEQVSGHCLFSNGQSHLAMAMIRALCPVTCGCNSLVNGTMFTSTSMGCPEICVGSVPQEERDMVVCEDVDPTSEDDPRVDQMVTLFGELQRAHNSSGLGKALGVFRQFGCTIAHSGADMCLPTGTNLYAELSPVGALPIEYIKMITMFCPEQCNCHGKRTGYNHRPPAGACPTACICDWTIQPAISNTAWSDTCGVLNPYPLLWPGEAPPTTYTISIDSQCCQLMNRLMWLIVAMGPGGGIDDLTVTERQLLVETEEHLCIPCRRSCRNELVRIIANATLRTEQQAQGDICSGYN